MKIEDNFLDQKEFDKLQKLILGPDFVWHYDDIIDLFDEDTFQFTHLFYGTNKPKSTFVTILNPMLDRINPFSVWRIKANLLTRTSNIVQNSFHIDNLALKDSLEKSKQWTTSIFYVNTNNGYTEFEDGTKVESVANRMITFPSNIKHRGTSCTDEKIRVVINFNYFK